MLILTISAPLSIGQSDTVTNKIFPLQACPTSVYPPLLILVAVLHSRRLFAEIFPSAMDSDDDDLVVIELRGSSSSTEEDDGQLSPYAISISCTEASSWDFSRIICSSIVKIRAHRNRLVEQSSYFRGLLGGCFSESKQSCVVVEWHPETTLAILQFICGSPIDITAANFLSILEGSLFFGVDALLLQCETWLGRATSAKSLSSLQIPLDNLIHIWHFGFERALTSMMEQCESYLARNFMWASSDCSFAMVPYDLLRSCLEHPHLTVDSEKHLCEALLVWLAHNSCSPDCHLRNFKEDYTDILRKVRVGLLPLCFAAGKRRNSHFSKLADKAIQNIFALTKDSSESVDHKLVENGMDDIRIRLTNFSERVDLSGCPQISAAILLLSIIPTSSSNDISIRKAMKQTLIDQKVLSGVQFTIPRESLSTMSFEAVHEVDISNCPRLHYDATLHCIEVAFPSLRVLKASHCLQFTMRNLYHLVQNCPLITEVDLSVDISPVIPSHVSVLSADVGRNPGLLLVKMIGKGDVVSKMSKLTLEGRTDIDDSDLQRISALSGSLSYLNLEGCTMITDLGISELISKCANLYTLLVSDTAFGRTSVLALCADFAFANVSVGLHQERKLSPTLACKLHRLHIGGCKSINKTYLAQLLGHSYSLKSLNLRETLIVDETLYSFMGTFLENLDISNTKVSKHGLQYIIGRNPSLKFLKIRDSRNLHHLSGDMLPCVLPHSNSRSNVKELHQELGHLSILEQLDCGWGFSSYTLEILSPAIRSLKSISVGLGATLGEHALVKLPELCPLLEIVILKFQVISSDAVKKLVESLRHLQTLVLCCCLGDVSSVSFQNSMPKLKTLRLESVAAWMTNDDLVVLSHNCVNLLELSLSGCPLLDSDSQEIISSGWPGLTLIHLENCGRVTRHGVSFLLECQAIEDLLLRHNGRGIPRRFIVEAASKMPMLRKLSVDLCDAIEGGFDSPSYADRFFLSNVNIACCRSPRCAFEYEVLEACRKPVHKETIVLEWNSKESRTTIVKERV